MSLSPGTRLGVYEVVAPLGAGGMAGVYRARDTRIDRPVAIKVADEEFIGRFTTEARAEARADALAAAHARSITHRDLKPANGQVSAAAAHDRTAAGCKPC